MGRLSVLIYGCVCYLIGMGSILYGIGFIQNFAVPKSIDTGNPATLGAGLTVDFLLLGLFGLQHSLMARPGFKAWWTRIVPPAVERSTYVLLSGLALSALFWLWQPLPGAIWSVSDPAGRAILHTLFGLGWLIMVAASFLISHWDLMGLRQTYLYFRGAAYPPLTFRIPLLYRVVRHPMMFGILIAFWSTPDMSVGRLLFSLCMTAYVLVATRLEERDLVTVHGEPYREYQRQVPMLFPLPRKPRAAERRGGGCAEP